MIQEIVIDGAVTQVGPGSNQTSLLHSNVMGCHSMRTFILTGQFGRSFLYTAYKQHILSTMIKCACTKLEQNV